VTASNYQIFKKKINLKKKSLLLVFFKNFPRPPPSPLLAARVAAAARTLPLLRRCSPRALLPAAARRARARPLLAPALALALALFGPRDHALELVVRRPLPLLRLAQPLDQGGLLGLEPPR
jgi:hypothetical protein